MTAFEEYVKKCAKEVWEKGKHNSFYEEPDDGVVFDMVPSIESLQRIGLDHLKY